MQESIRSCGSRTDSFSGRILILSVVLPALVVFVVLGATSRAFATASVNVPLGHWTYEAIDKVAGYNLIHSNLKGTRPYSRAEFARQLQEALVERTKSNRQLPPFLDTLLDRLKKEFQVELDSLEVEKTRASSGYIKPLDEVKIEYVFSDGWPRSFKPHQKSSIYATEGTPLYYNNNGINYGRDHNGSLQFSSYMGYGDFFAAYLQPIFVFRQSTDGLRNVDATEADLLMGYGKLSWWNQELQVGRDQMWWGQGYHGTLLMTNNAFPLDLLKLSNPSPILLPWYLSYLGAFKYTIFLSQLEEDRPIPNPLFAGVRLDFKPFPYLEFGAATTFIFNGEGRPSLTFEDFLGLLGFQGSGSNKQVNQLAALDMRLSLPFLYNVELYGEYGGEDSGSSRVEELIFRDLGYLVGMYVPSLTPDGRTDFRVEYAHNAFAKDQLAHRGFWYGHSIYRAGYTHDRMIMGHHMGPDAQDLFLRISRYITNDIRAGIDYDYMSRYLYDDTNKNINPRIVETERINEIGADVRYDVNSSVTILTRYAYRSVQNFNFRHGIDRNDQLISVGLEWHF